MKKNMSFDEAICYAKRGYAIKRECWSDEEYLTFTMCSEYDEFVLSYVCKYLRIENNYIPFYKDIAANDWELYLGFTNEGICIKEINYEV